MPAEARVRKRVELEVDLVEPARQVDGERRADLQRRQAPDEALGQPPTEEVPRACVEPAGIDSEVGGDRVARVGEIRGKRLRRREPPTFEQRDDVDVARRPVDEPEQREARAADDDELGALAREREPIAERGE